MTDSHTSDHTPILLHPARRIELLRLGQEHFNNENYENAQEMWRQLLAVEQGRDKQFVTALLETSQHFSGLQKAKWADVIRVGESALKAFALPAAHGTYRELDLTPVLSGIEYNINLLNNTSNKAILLPESFLYPKLFAR